ncbi:hypothetical protein DFQ27_005745 [Actinomortierella ambigua]|uniref:Uncharacterized protein n=1 Tax=Actinomortierella ambigua TaxID=1343610 RepID=A0A9P6PY18_9FUNG|nr:hypothetical protein DFQ27_005745 [Actinomortierella ambigua]
MAPHASSGTNNEMPSLTESNSSDNHNLIHCSSETTLRPPHPTLYVYTTPHSSPFVASTQHHTTISTGPDPSPLSSSASSHGGIVNCPERQLVTSPSLEAAFANGAEGEQAEGGGKVDPSSAVAVISPLFPSSLRNVRPTTTASVPVPAVGRTPSVLISPASESDLLHKVIQDYRHPFRPNLYTRLFQLDGPRTRRQLIVEASCCIGHKTGALLILRLLMFLYSFVVLVTDLILTERPQYSFCYLTQLSYLGLIAYLGAASWHTLSEWRRQRRTRAVARGKEFVLESGLATPSPDSLEGRCGETLETNAQNTTTLERQHWLLTDLHFFLYHTICTFHVIVPILYWSYNSYSGDAVMMATHLNKQSLWRNYSFHGLDLVLMLIEVAINKMPFVASHLLIVIFVAILYLSEALIVHAVDGIWMYPFLDTSNRLWALFYFGVGCAIVVAFFAMYYLHRLKYYFTDRHHTEQQHPIVTLPKKAQNSHMADLQQQQQQQQQQQTATSCSEHQQEGEVKSTCLEDDNTAEPNRKRSDSNTSVASSAMTLVGGDGVDKEGYEKSEIQQDPTQQ